MIKSLRVGETLRHKPQYEPWLVIRVFEYGWLVVDLTCADDPAIPKVVLPRYYDNWIREIDLTENEILDKTETMFNERDQRQWNNLLAG